jgi:hypothetical protein
MSNDRAKLRGVVVTEDRRTERFVRHLLVAGGYDKRQFRFRTAPSGRGAGEAWVLLQYPSEVKRMRANRHQRLCLIAVRDGDGVGVDGRKLELEQALRDAELQPRGPRERIATPVPTWAIENWLLDLLGYANVNEDQCPAADGGPTWKQVFERVFGADEKHALSTAAELWSTASIRLPSLADGRVELSRVDQ